MKTGVNIIAARWARLGLLDRGSSVESDRGSQSSGCEEGLISWCGAMHEVASNSMRRHVCGRQYLGKPNCR